MNDPRAARITGFVMSVFLLLGLTYLAFGERFGIKKPGPEREASGRCAEGIRKVGIVQSRIFIPPHGHFPGISADCTFQVARHDPLE